MPGSDGVPDTGATGDPQDTIAAVVTDPMRWFDEEHAALIATIRWDAHARPRHLPTASRPTAGRLSLRSAFLESRACVMRHRGIRPPVVGQRDQRLRERPPSAADPSRLVRASGKASLGRLQIPRREQIANRIPTRYIRSRSSRPGCPRRRPVRCPASGRRAATPTNRPSPGPQRLLPNSDRGIAVNLLLRDLTQFLDRRLSLRGPRGDRPAATNTARSSINSLGWRSAPASGCSPAATGAPTTDTPGPGSSAPSTSGTGCGHTGRQAEQPFLLHQHVLGAALHQRQPYDHVLAQPVHGR